MRFQRRHLRAQPTASFRTVERCRHVSHSPSRRLSRPPVTNTPAAASCIALPDSGGTGTPRADRLLFVRQPVPDSCRHVCLSRLFNEDSGDLGSLPAPRPSRSKPVTPKVTPSRLGTEMVTRARVQLFHRCRVRSTRYLVPGTRRGGDIVFAGGTRYEVRGTSGPSRYPVPGTRYPVFQVPSCQLARYFSCSGVNCSSPPPMASSLSLATSRSRSAGST